MSKSSSERLEHAKHNHNACEYLHLNGTFPDWVITTAFYTALHYISHKIFPLKIKDIEFPDLNSYYRFQKGINKAITKHKALSDLVSKKIPSISPDYDMLLDDCMNARYINYQIEKLIADRSVRLVKKIATVCG